MITKIKQLLKDNNFVNGRMLSFSKSVYREANPRSVCYFNANIFTLQEGKIWYGDLDLTKDALALKVISEQIGRTLFIVKELDGRFEFEDMLDFQQIINVAVWDTTQACPINK